MQKDHDKGPPVGRNLFKPARQATQFRHPRIRNNDHVFRRRLVTERTHADIGKNCLEHRLGAPAGALVVDIERCVRPRRERCDSAGFFQHVLRHLTVSQDVEGKITSLAQASPGERLIIEMGRAGLQPIL
jgi:hypothetical protein